MPEYIIYKRNYNLKILKLDQAYVSKLTILDRLKNRYAVDFDVPNLTRMYSNSCI
jgi:hypothetical protein